MFIGVPSIFNMIHRSVVDVEDVDDLRRGAAEVESGVEEFTGLPTGSTPEVMKD
jgi:hypothetical protein